MAIISLTSYGAAQEVTGSKHLLQFKNTKILLDCGMFQGDRKLSHEKNMKFGFDPASLDAVFLSHAHIDHCGLLPRLVKNGFSGPIFCSEATADLLDIMLRDSARIQEADEEYFKRHSELETPIEKIPLYTEEDVDQCLEHVEVIHLHEAFEFKDIVVTTYSAGHVIGSVIMKIQCGEKSVIFTGDLGREHMPLLIDREKGMSADYVIMESTYGGRQHEPITLSSQSLEAIIRKTISRGGKVVIPAFALERTQEILYYLEDAFKRASLPNIAIYVDSPMAANVTQVFQAHREIYDAEMKAHYRSEIPFHSRNIHFTETVEESKKINEDHVPSIIIAGSGMCEFGRIRHHLKNTIGNHRNTVLIVGYMAEGTLGRKLIEGEKQVSLFGEKYSVAAEIVKLNSFSGHADDPDLLFWIRSIQGVQKVVLVHGESSAQKILQEEIAQTIPNIVIAEFGKEIVL